MAGPECTIYTYYYCKASTLMVHVCSHRGSRRVSQSCKSLTFRLQKFTSLFLSEAAKAKQKRERELREPTETAEFHASNIYRLAMKQETQKFDFMSAGHKS